MRNDKARVIAEEKEKLDKESRDNFVNKRIATAKFIRGSHKSYDKCYDKVDVIPLWVCEWTSTEHYRINFWQGDEIVVSIFGKCWGDTWEFDKELPPDLCSEEK